MNRAIYLFLSLCVFASIGSTHAQHEFPRTDQQNTILSEVVKKLAEPTICGNPEWAEKEFYQGTIVKRDFDQSQVKLSGFVLRLRSDKREYINLDSEYISGRAHSASSDLADFLVVGRPVKVWVYRCRRVLYAYMISSYKP